MVVARRGGVVKDSDAAVSLGWSNEERLRVTLDKDEKIEALRLDAEAGRAKRCLPVAVPVAR